MSLCNVPVLLGDEHGVSFRDDWTVSDWLNCTITWQNTCDYENAKIAHKIKRSPLYKALL